MQMWTLADAVRSEDSGRSDGSLQGAHCLVQEIDAPSQLFFRRQVWLSHGIVKFAASHDSSHSDLRGDIREASNHDYGNAFFFDLLGDRSAATSAGPSSGGEDDSVDA